METLRNCNVSTEYCTETTTCGGMLKRGAGVWPVSYGPLYRALSPLSSELPVPACTWGSPFSATVLDYAVIRMALRNDIFYTALTAGDSVGRSLRQGHECISMACYGQLTDSYCYSTLCECIANAQKAGYIEVEYL